jgi:hypothetical protein
VCVRLRQPLYPFLEGAVRLVALGLSGWCGLDGLVIKLWQQPALGVALRSPLVAVPFFGRQDLSPSIIEGILLGLYLLLLLF